MPEEGRGLLWVCLTGFPEGEGGVGFDVLIQLVEGLQLGLRVDGGPRARGLPTNAPLRVSLSYTF